MRTSGRSSIGTRLGVLLCAFAAAAGGMLVASSAAQAQLPSICTQYPNDPECEVAPDTDGFGGDIGPDNGGLLGLGDGNGELPFTGYPVSILVLLALILLAAGLTARTISAIRRSRQARAAA